MSDNLVEKARRNVLADMPHYASVELIEAMADRIEELESKLIDAEWLLIEAMVQLREGKIKTRKNRADLIKTFLEELKETDQ